jgi:hypothetical protein
MRIVLIVACAAAFVFSAWSNTPTAADAQRTGTAAMNPVSLMAAIGNLPVEQFNAH